MSEHIGKYELLDRIAEGGFGVVFKARDPFIKRLVAIKTCALDHEDMRQRFFREAQIAGAFDHPNVTIVHDFGVEEGTAYLVQEYLSGEDLSAKIRRRDPLPVNVKIDYLLQIARGLAYAHGKGVIHRDIKPPNVRVLEGGHVKIMDFGIAKLATSSTRLTRQGMAVGTVGYLAPEQLADETLDHRTDIFAFGVVAYELFSYRRPFEGRDLSTVMWGILEGKAQPLSELVAGLPRGLESLVHKCLAKNREQRPASFEAVIAELEALQRHLEPASALAGDGHTVILATPALAGPEPGPPPSSTTASSPPSTGDERGPRTDPTLDTQQVEIPGATEVAGSSAGTTGQGEELPRVDDALQPRPPATADPAATAPVEPPQRPEAAPPPPRAPSVAPPVAPETGEPLGQERPTPPATPRGGALGGKTIWIVAGALVFVGLIGIAGLVGWWVLRWSTTEATVASDAPTTRATVPPPTPVAAPGRGVLTVVAAPWAEILSVVDEQGNEVPISGDRYTPALISVEPGTHRVVVASPDSPEPQECQIEVAIDQVASCRFELSVIEPIEYFRETGWWQ